MAKRSSQKEPELSLNQIEEHAQLIAKAVLKTKPKKQKATKVAHSNKLFPIQA
ncbi:MAG: hypothetical protein OXE59_07160 [Bacteroidetes bacterium]|nr:hypothetical protein [Bacteroidota bacterium]